MVVLLSSQADISIHAPREGGDKSSRLAILVLPSISIHAPREGGDYCTAYAAVFLAISIHAPREGGD